MRVIYYVMTTVCLLLLALPACPSRIKDIATLAGVRDNQLVGYGLVVGLDGTGDRTNQAPFTEQAFENMLSAFGVHMPAGARGTQLRNVAAVAVSAILPPFTKLGQKLDVTILSLGNATNLRGGSLLMTPLKGADGKIYAMAQGSVVVSGLGAQGADGSKVTVNVTSSGSILNGATVENTIDMPFVQNGAITFQLSAPDFTTAERVEQAINREFNARVAQALDAGSVRVRVDSIIGPSSFLGGTPDVVLKPRRAFYKGDSLRDVADNSLKQDTNLPPDEAEEKMRYVPLISRIENLELNPAEGPARVVVNSRTGTIVIGRNVNISPVAVSHGNLSVIVTEHAFVSQPNALGGGQTAGGSHSNIAIQQSNRAFVLAPGPSLNDLVEAINRVGAAPGDLIAILEAVKAAGALHADLDVI